MTKQDKEIFQVYLIGVNPRENISFENDKSENMKKAIIERKTVYLGRIMVQETHKPDTFKEIITGKEYITSIAYTKKQKDSKWHFSNNNLDNSLIIKPIIFNELNEKLNMKNKKELYKTYFNKASYNSLKEYLEKNLDKEKYDQELTELAEIAERSYQVIKKQTKEKDEYKIRKLIKEHNQKYTI